MSEQTKKRSELWLLVPMFSGILGGVVMYLLLKDGHERLARYCLYLGIGTTIIPFMVAALAVAGIGASMGDFDVPMISGVDAYDWMQMDCATLQDSCHGMRAGHNSSPDTYDRYPYRP